MFYWLPFFNVYICDILKQSEESHQHTLKSNMASPISLIFQYNTNLKGTSLMTCPSRIKQILTTTSELEPLISPLILVKTYPKAHRCTKTSIDSLFDILNFIVTSLLPSFHTYFYVIVDLNLSIFSYFPFKIRLY